MHRPGDVVQPPRGTGVACQQGADLLGAPPRQRPWPLSQCLASHVSSYRSQQLHRHLRCLQASGILAQRDQQPPRSQLGADSLDAVRCAGLAKRLLRDLGREGQQRAGVSAVGRVRDPVVLASGQHQNRARIGDHHLAPPMHREHPPTGQHELGVPAELRRAAPRGSRRPADHVTYP